MSDEEKLNGINLSSLKEVLEVAKRDHEKVKELSRWRARILWKGGLKSKAYVRNYSFTVDEPHDLAGVDTAPNAVEYIISALGACLVTGFVFNATKRGIRIEQLEVSLEGEIDNILRFLGLSDEGHPGYKSIDVKLYVSADADEKELEEIWKYTVDTSPVANTLMKNVNIKPGLSIVR